jgi:hypothetical protein
LRLPEAKFPKVHHENEVSMDPLKMDLMRVRPPVSIQKSHLIMPEEPAIMDSGTIPVKDSIGIQLFKTLEKSSPIALALTGLTAKTV